MKVYLTPPHTASRSLDRVVSALVQYAPPNVEIVSNQNAADLVVLHFVGRQERTKKTVEWLRDQKRRYAVIQYCIRSTRNPLTKDWFPLWQGAVLVWSYLDLKALCSEDGTSQDFTFYHSPLGVDATVFYRRPHERPYMIGTNGPSWLSESIREAVYAARRVGRPVFHLGPQMNRGPDMLCMNDISDDTLANWYSQCEFVAGLRRTEGFELPAAEGLLCGARPICYDRPHYRKWYEPWAVFIPETSRALIIDDLEVVFHSGARPVTDTEQEAARKRFDWDVIVSRFWDRCGEA